MKRNLLVMPVALLIAALLLPGIALCEEAIVTPMDTSLKYHLTSNPAIVIEQLPVVFNVETVPLDDQYQLQLLSVMLVDLYVYETSVLGKSADESLAADIYRGLQQEAGIACLTAVNDDAILVNGLFAKNDGNDSGFASMYWFEYNIEEDTLRVAYNMTIEKCADAEGFLAEYVFANRILDSVGANPFISSLMPDDSVYGFYDGKNIMSFFDGIYEDLYNAAPDL